VAVVTDNDKKNTISRLQQYCATILDTIAAAKLLRQEAIDKGYQTGGADAITDAFLNANGSPPPFPGLAVADLTAGLAAINNLDTQLAATSRTDYRALEKLRP
jgi:hypothetical protein